MELNLNELLECQLHRWFEKFKKYTIKTISIPLPIEFVEYLKEDGIILPKGVAVPGFSDSENNGIWLSENKNDVFDCDSSNQFDFSELISEIEKAMSKLGGAVVPKLNWSCPQDSIWINSETLKCSSVGELILLLKSSDKVAQDLSLGMDHPTELIQFYVNLRKWSNLNPSQEFRCFVRGKHLIGICQRDMNGFHSQLNDKEKLNSIREVVHSFIQTSNEMFPCDSYVMDVYIDKSGRLWIIDFNPFCKNTDPLLFSWDELLSANAQDFQFRIVESDSSVRLNPNTIHRLPQELINLSSTEVQQKLEMDGFLDDKF